MISKYSNNDLPFSFYFVLCSLQITNQYFSASSIRNGNGVWLYQNVIDWLSCGLTTRQPLWVILCRLPEKGRK